MLSRFRALVALVALASAPVLNASPVQAQDFAIAAQVGTTGLGGGVVIGVVPRISLRVMYGVVPPDPSLKIDDIDFVLGLPPFLLTTVDLYPVGALHFSVGGLLITNGGDLEVVGTFEGRQVRFGGMLFTGGIDDRLVGTFSLKRFQPYAGIGIGNPVGRRISINFDAGVGFGSSPTVVLDPVGPLADDPITGPTYRSQVAQEVPTIQAEIPDILRYYPVLSVSLSIGF